MKYELITKYIGSLKDPGDWVESKQFDGKYKTVAYVGYSKEAYQFIDDVYTLVYEYEELKRYGEVLEKSNIFWNESSMHEANVNELDAITVLSLILGIVRADRFSEGVLLKFLKDGTIEKWLKRLKELDNN